MVLEAFHSQTFKCSASDCGIPADVNPDNRYREEMTQPMWNPVTSKQTRRSQPDRICAFSYVTCGFISNCTGLVYRTKLACRTFWWEEPQLMLSVKQNPLSSTLGPLEFCWKTELSSVTFVPLTLPKAPESFCGHLLELPS